MLRRKNPHTASGKNGFIHEGAHGESVPLLTSEGFFGQHVCELVVCVGVVHLDHLVKVDPVKQPVKCHPVGAGNVSHLVELLPLIIILITASLSSKMNNKAVRRDCVAFGGTKAMSSMMCSSNVSRAFASFDLWLSFTLFFTTGLPVLL